MNSDAEADTFQTDGQLWVDKYAPTKFMDLLTDDLVNRKVMTWLKSWDDLAFPDREIVSLKAPQIGRKSTNPFAAVARTSNSTAVPSAMEDEFNKSYKKILMLYGPPGSGKSTLARVLARQVGYETREVNASDRRNGDDLINEIRNSVSTNAHFNKAGSTRGISSSSDMTKPVCLILDEIDGALGGGTDQQRGMGQVAAFLKRCIREKQRQTVGRLAGQEKGAKSAGKEDDEEVQSESDNDGQGNQVKNGSGAQKKQQFSSSAAAADLSRYPNLNRPIIMVCNDGYAKALLPLKNLVLKLRVLGPSQQRVNERLIEILRAENIRDVSNAVRSAVVLSSNGDARSAITRVQMIASNRGLIEASGHHAPQLLKEQTNLASLQTKDISQSTYDIVEDILRGRNQAEVTEDMDSGRCIKQVQQKVASFGDSPALNTSLFENYLTMKRFYDDDFEKVASFMECMSLEDVNQAYVRRQQDYSMQSFSYLPAACFKAKSTEEHTYRSNFSYAKSHYQQKMEMSKYDDILDSLLDLKSNKTTFKRFNRDEERQSSLEEAADVERIHESQTFKNKMRLTDLKKDFLPYIYQMIHPEVRGEAVQFMKADEKQRLQAAIETMVLFDIQLIPSQSNAIAQNNSHLIPSWSPDITSLVCFGGEARKSRTLMQPRLQSVILQNYTQIKNSMLSRSLSSQRSTLGALIPSEGGDKSRATAMISEPKASLFDLMKQQTQQPNKKRARQANGGDDDDQGIGGRKPAESGTFIYKFKEGHSKNFKRELTMDFFIN